MNPELDRLFLQGKLSEDEYCALAMEDGQVVAVAVDEIDRVTTVSLTLAKSGYIGEVLYSPESGKKDEKFMSKEKSFDLAKTAFLSRIQRLEAGKKHNFDLTWFVQTK